MLALSITGLVAAAAGLAGYAHSYVNAARNARHARRPAWF